MTAVAPFYMLTWIFFSVMWKDFGVWVGDSCSSLPPFEHFDYALALSRLRLSRRLFPFGFSAFSMAFRSLFRCHFGTSVWFHCVPYFSGRFFFFFLFWCELEFEFWDFRFAFLCRRLFCRLVIVLPFVVLLLVTHFSEVKWRREMANKGTWKMQWREATWAAHFVLHWRQISVDEEGKLVWL